MKQRYKIGAWFVTLCAFSHVYNVFGNQVEAGPPEGEAVQTVRESREAPVRPAADAVVPVQLALAADRAIATTMSLTLDGVMQWRHNIEPGRFLAGADRSAPVCTPAEATRWHCVHIGYSETQWREVWAAATPSPFSFINFGVDWLGLQPIRAIDQALAKFRAGQATQLTGRTSGKQDGTAVDAAPVPVPPAMWLFASAIAGLAGIARRRNAS